MSFVRPRPLPSPSPTVPRQQAGGSSSSSSQQQQQQQQILSPLLHCAALRCAAAEPTSPLSPDHATLHRPPIAAGRPPGKLIDIHLIHPLVRPVRRAKPWFTSPLRSTNQPSNPTLLASPNAKSVRSRKSSPLSFPKRNSTTKVKASKQIIKENNVRLIVRHRTRRRSVFLRGTMDLPPSPFSTPPPIENATPYTLFSRAIAPTKKKGPPPFSICARARRGEGALTQASSLYRVG
ncbi:hypothetical protein BS50DRAFT_171114 [Corynespora cassiicola Philippines]|uniref:Uncharacterized protein n=1 Tax=Corynespora cassiicola Philippines TaxID=1448308 RepID=A0A2T2P585_CORCC|nr:hypothetical protein BS50DRAFT_171114 [Corynespora cassiicola Philippines]